MNDYKLVKNTEWKEVEVNGELKEIPMDWEMKKFEEFSSICRGGSPRPIQTFLTNKQDGTPWIKISDATKVKKYIDSTEQYILKEGESRSRLVYPGDLIVSNSATPGIPRFLNITACIHDGWLLLRDFKGIDKEFLFQLVGMVREKLKSQGSGSIFTNLSIDILSNFECLLPPLSQQTSIADILSNQESIIQDIESLILKYQSRFQYLSEELLSGRLRVKEVNGQLTLYKNADDNWKEVEINGEIKEIPQDWNVDKLIKKSDFISGVTIDKNELRNQKLPNDTLFLRANNIEESGIVNFNNLYYISTIIKPEQYLQKNDILICLASGSKHLVGKTALVTSLPSSATIGSFCGIIRTTNLFTYYITKGYEYKNWLNQFEATSIFNLKRDNLLNFEIINPINHEQLLIQSILYKLEDSIKSQKNLLAKEKQKLDWLLDNLLSGKYLIKEN